MRLQWRSMGQDTQRDKHKMQTQLKVSSLCLKIVLINVCTMLFPILNSYHDYTMQFNLLTL